MSGDIRVVFYWAEWCGPCRAMRPSIDELESRGLVIERLEHAEHARAFERDGVVSIPMLRVMRGGKCVKQILGLHSMEQLVEQLEEIEDLVLSRPSGREGKEGGRDGEAGAV